MPSAEPHTEEDWPVSPETLETLETLMDESSSCDVEVVSLADAVTAHLPRSVHAIDWGEDKGDSSSVGVEYCFLATPN